MKNVDYDVIIIGSGVAGALCAWRLAQYNRYKILILEAGDNGITHGQRVEFHHMMDTQGNRGDMYAPYKDLESRVFAPQPENAQKELADQVKEDQYYDYTAASKEAFKAGYNRIVGGSTWSWRGNCPRYIASDFKLQSNFGVGRDWPIDYHELEPWYCDAERELGVAGLHEELDGLFGSFRSKPFPMTGIPLAYSDQQVRSLIEGKVVRGGKIMVRTTPQARNSTPFDNRPACEGHSNCIPLCPIQAKYDATVHLRRALENPDVRLKTATVVTSLAQDGEGKRVTVRYKDWRSDDPQKERELTAGLVVLAAHAIESPKILLMSKLANSSGQVGRNLMDHVQYEVIARFPKPLYPFRGPQSVVGIETYRDGEFRKEHSAFRMTIGNDGWGRAGSPATVIDKLLKAGKYGSALPDAIADEIPRMLRISFSTEMLPEAENFVDLSDKSDALGIPRPRFTFDIGDYVRKGLAEGYETAKELFAVMGAQVIDKPLVDGNGKTLWNTAAHIMGTCIMGDDPKTSVVDRWGRSHDVPNLWVAGSSVFTTSATSNPTLTIAALTLRMAGAIHRQLSNA
jgi:glucose dehydrogenase